MLFFFFLEFIISLRDGHCDYSSLAPTRYLRHRSGQLCLPVLHWPEITCL